jgi:hypothetical protein
MTEYPLGMRDLRRLGLYRQLAWAADTLNRYYSWRVDAVSVWVLADGTVVPADPTINAGTAAAHLLFAELGGHDEWEQDLSEAGWPAAYARLFGDPFALAIEPVVPPSLGTPSMQLPFEPDDAWYFTGGPHGGWDSGSAWAALDFGPSGDTASCSPSARGFRGCRRIHRSSSGRGGHPGSG